MSMADEFNNLTDERKEQLRRKFLSQEELSLVNEAKETPSIDNPTDLVDVIDKLCYWLWTEGGYGD